MNHFATQLSRWCSSTAVLCSFSFLVDATYCPLFHFSWLLIRNKYYSYQFLNVVQRWSKTRRQLWWFLPMECQLNMHLLSICSGCVLACSTFISSGSNKLSEPITLCQSNQTVTSAEYDPSPASPHKFKCTSQKHHSQGRNLYSDVLIVFTFCVTLCLKPCSRPRSQWTDRFS